MADAVPTQRSMTSNIVREKPESEDQPTVKKLRIDEDAASVDSVSMVDEKMETVDSPGKMEEMADGGEKMETSDAPETTISADDMEASDAVVETPETTDAVDKMETTEAVAAVETMETVETAEVASERGSVHVEIPEIPAAETAPSTNGGSVASTPNPSATPTGFGGFTSFAGGGFSSFAKPAEGSSTSGFASFASTVQSTSSGFAAFAKSAESSTPSGFSSFASSASPTSGFGAFAAKASTDENEGFGEAATADFDPNAEEATAEFTPVVTLSEAEVANGEEEERIIVEKRAKLFKLVGTDYVEVGIGPFRVLKPKDANEIEKARASARMVMRRESYPRGPGTKLILNARVAACVSCTKKSEKSLMLVVVEAAAQEGAGEAGSQQSEAKLKPVTYLLRFGSQDDLVLVQDRIVDLLPVHTSSS